MRRVKSAAGLSVAMGAMVLGVMLATAAPAAAATPSGCKMWRVGVNGASVACDHVNGGRYRALVYCQRGTQPSYQVGGPFMTRDRGESTAFCATTADRVLHYNWATN